MEKKNNFQIAKDQPQGVAYLLLNFFANFSLVLLIKVLLVKKTFNDSYVKLELTPVSFFIKK